MAESDAVIGKIWMTKVVLRVSAVIMLIINKCSKE